MCIYDVILYLPMISSILVIENRDLRALMVYLAQDVIITTQITSYLKSNMHFLILNNFAQHRKKMKVYFLHNLHRMLKYIEMHFYFKKSFLFKDLSSTSHSLYTLHLIQEAVQNSEFNTVVV